MPSYRKKLIEVSLPLEAINVASAREKKAWYERPFPGQLITTEESSTLSDDASTLIKKYFN